MTDADDLEAVAFLAGSPARVRILRTLRSDGPTSRDEFRTVLDAARTTVGRNLDALVERGWIARTGSRYELTPCGRLVLDGFEEARGAVRAADRLGPFVRWVDDDALDIDLRALADASVVTGDQTDPFAMVNAHVRRLREAERFRGCLPLVGLHAFETVHDRVIEDGAVHELVVTPGVAATLRESEAYADLYGALAACPRFSAYRYDGDIPFYVGLLDGTVQVGVDDDGDPQALLESTDPRVLEWAERTYRHYREAAAPLG